MSKNTQQLPTSSRKGDRLIPFENIPGITTLTEATHRYMRHKGEGPPIFRLGNRRLVCWESDLFAWIEAEAAKDAEARGADSPESSDHAAEAATAMSAPLPRPKAAPRSTRAPKSARSAKARAS